MSRPDHPAADETGPDTVTDVVAIDGPSGAGKSTVARELARVLGFAYLDTGAMYRAVTWHFLAHQIGDVAGLDQRGRRLALELLDSLELRLEESGDRERRNGQRVLVNGEDVSNHLRSREVESRVSAVSAMSEVRHSMRRLQREIAQRGPLVAEGRDMASVVFPRARWKFFLDAEPEERARRRLSDFVRRGRNVTFDQVLDEIAVRDRLDSTRADAPLTRAPGAVYFDTSGLTIDDVVRRLAEHVRRGDRGAEVPGAEVPS